MSLPLTRNTTYAIDSQVKSVDLNAMQDAIVDLNARVRGVRTYPVDGGTFYGNAIVSIFAGSVGSARFLATEAAEYSAPVIHGKRVTAVRVRANDTVGNLTIRMVRKDNVGNLTFLGSNVNSTAAGDQTITANFPAATQATGSILKLRVTANGGGGTQHVHLVEWDFDEP